MIEYKAIGFEDLDIFRPYLRWEDVQGCEWSSVNLLTWNRFGLEYAIGTPAGPVKANLNWSSVSKALGLYVSLGFDF